MGYLYPNTTTASDGGNGTWPRYVCDMQSGLEGAEDSEGAGTPTREANRRKVQRTV